MPKQKSLKDLFLNFARPDKDGFSEIVLLSDLIAIDTRFATGNGGHWCRSDGSLKEYNIRRIKEKNKIVAVKLDGKNYAAKNRSIKTEIRQNIVANSCAVLGINSDIQCDHRNGKYNNRSVSNVNTQKVEDFQPLSRGANDAKRTHCNKCVSSGERFDARVLGYSVGWLKGDVYTLDCAGCYWAGPREFNQEISLYYKKTK